MKTAPSIDRLKKYSLDNQLQTCFSLSPLELNKQSIISALAASEQEQLNKYQYPKRQNEWLAGRLVAKKCAQEYFSTFHDIKLSYPEIIIENREDGRPTINISEHHDILPDISISHSSNYAVAQVAKDFCGIDTQKAVPTLTRVKERYCSPAEEKILLSSSSSKEDLNLLSQLWSAKEAIQKMVSSEDTMPGFMELVLEQIDNGNVDIFHFSRVNSEEIFQVVTTTYSEYAISSTMQVK